MLVNGNTSQKENGRKKRVRVRTRNRATIEPKVTRRIQVSEESEDVLDIPNSERRRRRKES